MKKMVKQSRYIDLNPEVFGLVTDVLAEIRGVARSSAVRMLRQNVESFFVRNIVTLEKGIIVFEGG